MSAAAPARPAIDLSRRDLTLDLARVFCVLLVVVIHLLFVGVGHDASGTLVVSRPVEQQAWFPLVTWAGQIMPLFFVVGGFAGLTAWRSAGKRGESAAAFVRARLLRLATPALPLFLFYVVVLGVAALIRFDPALVQSIATGVGSPLWFLAAYSLCQALIPFMAGWHARAPRATLAVLLAAAVVADVVRYTVHVDAIGLVNLAFVWLLVQQLGFWYADGWFDRRRPWHLVLIAAAAYGALVPLTQFGPYAVNMLNNLNPPTLPLIALGVAQACVLRLLKPALTALMRTRAAQAVVFVVGSRLMTIYLWHLPLIIILSGATLLIPGAAPEPATAAWWLSRPILYVVVLIALFGLSFLVGRFERLGELGPAPAPIVVAIAAIFVFTPAVLILQFFLNLGFAILGALLYSGAIVLLTRRFAPTRQPLPEGRPATSR